MLNLSTLNPPQRDAVINYNGPMLILAGAGTGKTRVITFRIAHMIANGVAADSIVALSFTNKAAREMAERVKALIGSAKSKEVRLSTFHSFCLNLLRQHQKASGLAVGFGLAGTSDQIDLVRRGLEEKNWAGLYQADRMLFKISAAKGHLLSPQDIRDGKGPKIEDPLILADVYDLYERQLRLNRVIDFDDCIYKLVKMVEKNPEVRLKLRNKFKYFLVDEFQDTNFCQLSVLKELVGEDHNVCAVGDDDQSIYSWRGAMYEVLEQYEELFPGTTLVKLEQNYRCSTIILDAANEVIKNNSIRKDKTLWCEAKDTGPIQLTPQPDEAEEANFLAEKCIALLGSGKEPREIGVLYRANNQSKAIELALRESRIVYKTFGGQSFFERKEVKDFLCYIRLALNPQDHLALWRIINYPSRGIGLKSLETIEEIAKKSGRPPFSVIKREGLGLPKKTTESLIDFSAKITALGNLPLSTSEDVLALGNAILEDCGLLNDIKTKEKNIAKRAAKIENLKSIPLWLSRAAEDLIQDEGYLNPQSFLDNLCLERDKKEKDDKQGNYVSLMTIHGSKGLEFPCVFVVGLEEDLLPHKNSITSPQGLAEERRLFYVAITRAKEKLFLSYARERSAGFQKNSRIKSRFLKEIPADCLSSIDAQIDTVEVRKEKRKQSTLSKLSALRGSLKIK
jgi:DNA helicase II / ATP-dependent DNA helicase PcrA